MSVVSLLPANCTDLSVSHAYQFECKRNCSSKILKYVPKLYWFKVNVQNWPYRVLSVKV